MCHCKCKNIKKIVYGLLLLLNAFVWPQWMGIDGWLAWIGVLMVFSGALMLVLPKCKCEDNKCCELPAKPAVPKKGKK